MKNQPTKPALAIAMVCALVASAIDAELTSAQKLKPVQTERNRNPESVVHRNSSQHGQSYALVDDDILYVTGDGSHERFIVQYAFGQDEIIVQRSAKSEGAGVFGPWETFLLQDQDIDSIIADLGPGDDTFLNETDLPSVISGNSGHDVLLGGHGPDQIYGGSGGDVIFGYGGADYIEGGPQSDILCGGLPLGSEQFFNYLTLEIDYSKLKPENFLDGSHVDQEMDELRGGFENAAVDADWFIMEVTTTPSVMETSIAIDFVEDFDWMTFNNHD